MKIIVEQREGLLGAVESKDLRFKTRYRKFKLFEHMWLRGKQGCRVLLSFSTEGISVLSE